MPDIEINKSEGILLNFNQPNSNKPREIVVNDGRVKLVFSDRKNPKAFGDVMKILTTSFIKSQVYKK